MKQTMIYYLSPGEIDSMEWKDKDDLYKQIKEHERVQKFDLQEFIHAFNSEWINDAGYIISVEQESPNEELELLKKELECYKKQSILWSIDDFIQAAIDKEGKSWENTYNQFKFQEALEHMIRNHDAQYGISWSTVNDYLDKYCLQEVSDDDTTDIWSKSDDAYKRKMEDGI